MTSIPLRIAKYCIRDLLRSRWLVGYALFFLASTSLLFRMSDTESKALLSLANVVLLIVPLVNVLFGTVYLYNSREFVELLLAQPIRRRTLFAGLWLGLIAPAVAAAVCGIGVPMLLLATEATTWQVGAVLLGMCAALTVVFAGIATVVAYVIDDRVRGLAVTLAMWLLLAVIYDALTLMAAVQFADYPLERALLAATIANPIDLARIVLVLQFDVSAMLGYTGAVFARFFGDASGMVISGMALLGWAVVPMLIGVRVFRRKDF